jgi:nitroreductase/NAD-dependent dihydropyrimidine dehydrogenase PreA subunit
MIVVDKKTCRGCGLCAEICHEGCISLVENGNHRVASVHHELCSTCTQCIAICARQALSWDSVPPVTYDESRLPSAEQLDELFKERRTIRRFKEDRIERALLEEIVGYGIYAPTNNYTLRAIVVDDPAMMVELDQIILQFVSMIYKLMFRPRPVFALLRRITPSVQRKDKVKMESDLGRGGTFDRPPPAMVFIAGDRRIGLTEASAQYALYNMILYAQARGIGSRLKGTGPIFLNRSKAARQRLGLRKHERIFGTLEFGYPDVRFRNKVEGKTLSLQWNEGATNV